MKSLFGIVITLATALCAHAQEGRYDWQRQDVESFAPGVRHGVVMAETPRPMRIHAVQIDTQSPGLDFVTTPRCDGWKANKEETEREPARDFVREAHVAGTPVAVAINADAFSPWPATWNEGTRTNLCGLAVCNGEVVSPPSDEPSFVVYKDGKVRIEQVARDADLSAIDTAISGFSFCLKAGEPQPSGDDTAPRTGIGVDAEGRFVYFVTIDGRRRASQGATTQELGQWLRHFGAHDGLNLDGGGSTTLVRWNPALPGPDKTEVLNQPVGNGINWIEQEALLEKLLAQPTERFNGNHLGVVVAIPKN